MTVHYADNGSNCSNNCKYRYIKNNSQSLDIHYRCWFNYTVEP